MTPLQKTHRSNLDKADAINKFLDIYDTDIDIQSDLNLYTQRSNPIQVIDNVGFDIDQSGAVTQRTEAEDIDLPLDLPSKNISWNLNTNIGNLLGGTRTHNYTLAIHVDGVSTVKVKQQGQPSFTRTVSSYDILSLSSGVVQISSTAAITRVELRRFSKYSVGSLIIGPFTDEGLVSVTPVGPGEFACELASNYELDASLTRSINGPVYNQRSQRVRRAPTGRGQGDLPEISDPVRWSEARYVKDNLPDLQWHPTLAVGLDVSDAEIVSLDSFQEYGGDNYWTNFNTWAVLPSDISPSFNQLPLYYTYVWGRVVDSTNVYESINPRTGIASNPSVNGFHMISTDTPDSIEIEGLYSIYPEPLRSPSDPLFDPNIPHLIGSKKSLAIPPGGYIKRSVSKTPDSYFIKITGKGLIRSVDIRTVQNALSPSNDIIPMKTMRFDLSMLDLSASNSDARPVYSRGKVRLFPTT